MTISYPTSPDDLMANSLKLRVQDVLMTHNDGSQPQTKQVKYEVSYRRSVGSRSFSYC